MIFLFRFDQAGSGLNFCMNEGIANDMYPDIHEKLIPFVEKAGNALSPFKIYTTKNTVMEMFIDDENVMQVQLAPGLGSIMDTYNPLAKIDAFTSAECIANLLIEVMNRRTLESKSSE
jgi:hypothetical protein